jgi:hypothetical protein
MRRTVALLAATAVLALGCAAPASAETRVDLQLILAVDTSGSVSHYRFELQKQGYVAAFRNPRLINAIRTGSERAIAVSMVQWTGPALQVQVVPWRLLNDEASTEAMAAAIDAAPRHLFGGGTSISGAIDYAVTLFDHPTFRGARQVIDISGDGVNNRGRPVTDARDSAVRAGISINGLPILALEPRLDEYYRDNVIGGSGAFVVVAETYEAFGEAILRKLVTEIADLRPDPCRRNARGIAGLEVASLVEGIDRLRPAGSEASASHPLGIEVGLEAGAVALQRALGSRSVGTLENPVLPCR